MMQVDLGNLKLQNPLQEIKIVVLQNYDWNNQVKLASPPMLRNHVLHIDAPYQLYTPGDNEFRYFDSKSTKFVSERVDRITYFPPDFHFSLKPDQLARFDPYFSSTDLNGRSFIEIPDAHDRHLESDYVQVHFTLESPQSLGTDVYIYGKLTNWEADEDNYMVYNPERGAYEATLLLKQGMINYMYATRDYDQKQLQFDLTEGSHSETENDYLIFVYLSELMSDFDRLIGYTVVNSAETIR
jgi:hypothetical protein